MAVGELPEASRNAHRDMTDRQTDMQTGIQTDKEWYGWSIVKCSAIVITIAKTETKINITEEKLILLKIKNKSKGNIFIGPNLCFGRILYLPEGAIRRCSRRSRVRLYNSAESEPLWMISGVLWVHYWGVAQADFGRDPRSSDSLTGRRRFVFLSGK